MSEKLSFWDPLTTDSLIMEIDESAAWAFVVENDGETISGDSWLWNECNEASEWNPSIDRLPGLPRELVSPQAPPRPALSDLRVRWLGLGASRQARIIGQAGELLACVLPGHSGGYSIYCRQRNPIAAPLLEAPELVLSDQTMAAVARRLAYHGCFDLDEIVLILSEDLQTSSSMLRQEIVDIVKREHDSKRREESNWPDETDVDRLKSVARDLASDGIELRFNWGHNRMHGVRLARSKDSFAFVPFSDVANTMRGKGLALSFIGSDAMQVGENLVRRLNSAGFSTRWAHDQSSVVLATNCLWQVRNTWKERSPDFHWRFSFESRGTPLKK